MTALRVLHVDDEPDIREVVEISLGLDPDLVVRSCASGIEGLSVATEWLPFIILLDVMMPVIDGPTTLARLRQNAVTADIPVLFMTARAQTREVDHFISLGARGVIPKPFDPMTLAPLVRSHLAAAGANATRGVFIRRAQADAAALAECRCQLQHDPASEPVLRRVHELAHGLAGAAGIFGLAQIGAEAASLEVAASRRRDGDGGPCDVERALDAVLARIAEEWPTRPLPDA